MKKKTCAVGSMIIVRIIYRRGSADKGFVINHPIQGLVCKKHFLFFEIMFCRSHCDCDAKFRRCLQNVNTETANTIGAIFFNIVQVICFKERSPCSQWQK